MIEISNLKKSFGTNVACDIDTLTIGEGEMIGLVGNNGAGKTTLFRMMLDLLKPDEGRVQLQGLCPAETEDWKDTTGAYIDEGFLIDYLTPEEYFAFIGRVSGMEPSLVAERLADFEALDNGEVLGQKKLIRNLSAGNKQKVGIMAAMLPRPSLLILDEPFNFLDPSGQSILKHTLVQYNQDTGATIIVSSHNLQHTTEISSRIVLLEKGRVVADIPNDSEQARQQIADYFERRTSTAVQTDETPNEATSEADTSGQETKKI